MRVKSKRKPAKKALPASDVKLGAASALERLEAEEASLFAAYTTAKAGGDALDAKVSRDAWLKCSESLRKFDLLIEAARRETGEVVPRKDVEVYLSNIGQILHWKFCKVTDKDHSWEIVDSAFSMAIAGYDPKVSSPVLNIPAWMHKALFKHGDWRRGKDLDTTLTTMRIIQEALDHHRDDEHKFFEFLKSHLRVPTPKGLSHEQEENAPA